MAKRSVKTATKKEAVKKQARETSRPEFLGLSLKTWVGGMKRATAADARSGQRGFVIALESRDAKLSKSTLSQHLSKWQQDHFAKAEGECAFYQGSQGPLWILRAPKVKGGQAQNRPASTLEKSIQATFRDLAGGVVSQLNDFNLDKLIIEIHATSIENAAVLQRGLFLGFELAAYRYAENRPESAKKRKVLPKLLLRAGDFSLTDREIKDRAALGLAVNLARHLVNVPAGQLNPRTYAEAVEGLFADSDNVQVEVWRGQKLIDERMGLLNAVGGAASEGPRLVRLSYRPKTDVALQPLALVGKGITFDTGGLDLKPSSGMRLMKKDMGGSAAAVGVVLWASAVGLPIPLDAYLSLAENSVSANAFRPGDIVTARSGLTIEIHNTDAEGRLVLADAIDVAVSRTGADEPCAVIDLATLTGAIKVALGADVAGLFSNNDSLARQIEEAALASGEPVWRMPLFQPYKSMLRSTPADHANASDSGFAGAITAALFLELFVKDVPWAHLDIYSWKDSAGGAWLESGGSGQPVQALAELLSRMAREILDQQGKMA